MQGTNKQFSDPSYRELMKTGELKLDALESKILRKLHDIKETNDDLRSCLNELKKVEDIKVFDERTSSLIAVNTLEIKETTEMIALVDKIVPTTGQENTRQRIMRKRLPKFLKEEHRRFECLMEELKELEKTNIDRAFSSQNSIEVKNSINVSLTNVVPSGVSMNDISIRQKHLEELDEDLSELKLAIRDMDRKVDYTCDLLEIVREDIPNNCINKREKEADVTTVDKRPSTENTCNSSSFWCLSLSGVFLSVVGIIVILLL
eukprot:TRINITY_DN1881_c0_g1_i4.p1 TRINITY_DN1881_c0_g1~~TRINITY_DN1881_c0_g1_i4.p1  ORF type:complete len:262 (-),score=46.50 TRINITY_DN1881_c0_g1_i4:119-904(-)